MKIAKYFVGVVLGSVFVLGLAIQTSAQKVLPEITIIGANYKYLSAVSPEETAQPVDMLQEYAAAFDVNASGFYEEEYDRYLISFFIPEGKILAAYDKKGTLLHTAERYKDVAVPDEIKQAVSARFPLWAITKDVYVVNYYAKNGGSTKKVYKLLLENGNKRMRVKVNAGGEFL